VKNQRCHQVGAWLHFQNVAGLGCLTGAILMRPDFSRFVFANPSNPSTHLKGVRRSWKSALKKAEIDYFPIYNLRAAFASRLMAAGCTDAPVAQMLGHSSLGIIHTYAKAIAKLDNLRNSQRMHFALYLQDLLQ
jgi:integrase